MPNVTAGYERFSDSIAFFENFHVMPSPNFNKFGAKAKAEV